MSTGRDVRLLSEEFRADPYGFYESLHVNAPVSYSRANGAFLVNGFDAAKEVLTNWETFGSALRQPAESSVYGADTMIFSDPPLHTQLRREWSGVLGRSTL